MFSIQWIDARDLDRRGRRWRSRGNQGGPETSVYLQSLSIQYRRFAFSISGPADDILQHAAVLLDRSDRPDVIVVARHQHPVNAECFVRNLKGQTKHSGRVALSSELRDHGIADMPADAQEELIQFMADGHPPHDSRSRKRKQECRRNVIRRKILTSRVLCQHLKIACERHALLVIVQEIRDVRRRGSVSAQEFLFLVFPRQSEHQRVSHVSHGGWPDLASGHYCSGG